jgi:putative transposase
MYHFVCPAKYRKSIFIPKVEKTLKEVCLQISERYEIVFLEIGVDKNHVHFLVQSVLMYSPKKIIQIIKSLTAREIFARIPEVKKQLWGGQFWSDGYFVSTVGKHGYVKNQGESENYKMWSLLQEIWKAI